MWSSLWLKRKTLFIVVKLIISKLKDITASVLLNSMIDVKMNVNGITMDNCK
jgi:hypothetical protein